MDSEAKSNEPDSDDQRDSSPQVSREPASFVVDKNGEVAENGPGEVEEGDEGDDDEEQEPKLKYTRITGHLSSVYRSGDSTSAFLASGDKLVMGTHNGNIQVFTLPTFETLRQYRAHSATITDVSVSPYFPHIRQKGRPKPSRTSTAHSETPPRNTASKAQVQASPKSPHQKPPIPNTLDNSIHIGTASIDGYVSVFSLTDSKDVTRRNYSRPIHAIALSPEFKSDRSFLCGGTAGDLILTSGAKTGVTTEVNTNAGAGGASMWLGSLGLGSGSGKDTVLHSGEGAISMIAWSLTGRYVAWVNEEGIKIMRSNLYLSSQESDSAWKRLAHVDLDRPHRRSWEDMAGAWKARAQWVDDQYLEPSLNSEDDTDIGLNEAIAASLAHPASETGSIKTARTGTTTGKASRTRPERLVVGWGDTVWIVHITSTFAKPELAHRIQFDDCIVSGLALYTPSVLLLLAFRTKDDNDRLLSQLPVEKPKKGVRRRGNALPPDLRLIDLDSPEEDKTIEVEGLEMKDYHSLASGDYQMCTLFVPKAPPTAGQQRGTIEALTSGLWGAGTGASRLFSSGASVLSGSSGERTLVSSSVPQATKTSDTLAIPTESVPYLFKPGVKVFIQSPFDCIVAVKTDKVDRLTWLLDTNQYQMAWNLVDQHPEIVSLQEPSDSRPGTPIATPRQSLPEFFTDDGSSHMVSTKQDDKSTAAARQEKLRIGELWLQQLIDNEEWNTAGVTMPKVLGLSPKWERWIWNFIETNHVDSISPHIPPRPLQPQISPRVYEAVLQHYIASDRLRLMDLLNDWDLNLFDTTTVISQIEKTLEDGGAKATSVEDGVEGRDWKILMDCLAKLYLADGRPSDALKCFLRTKNGDAALDLVAEYNILQDIEDVYDFILLRVDKDQLSSSSVQSLEQNTSEAMGMLVSAALSGLITAEHVIQKLQSHLPTAKPLLYIYLRSLWLGKTQSSENEQDAEVPRPRRSRFNRNFDSTMSKSRTLLDNHGDLCVSLFADYSRDLLNDLLKTTDIYNFNHAIAECQSRNYTPELVHLLTRTGRPHDALHLIIDELGDVSQAIAFAQDQDDQGLWDDLIQYSMDKPKFIVGLLEHGGGGGAGSVDAADLVRRLPDRLEIEGLKPAIHRLLKQAEIQCSISEGAAKVFRGEVGGALGILQKGRSKGIAVDAIPDISDRGLKMETSNTPSVPNQDESGKVEASQNQNNSLPTHTARGKMRCSICSKPIVFRRGAAQARPSSSQSVNEPEPLDPTDKTLLVFPCGHVQHLTCILDNIPSPNAELRRRITKLLQLLSKEEAEKQIPPSLGVGRPKARVGDKAARAQMIADVLGDRTMCALCADTASDTGE